MPYIKIINEVQDSVILLTLNSNNKTDASDYVYIKYDYGFGLVLQLKTNVSEQHQFQGLFRCTQNKNLYNISHVSSDTQTIINTDENYDIKTNNDKTYTLSFQYEIKKSYCSLTDTFYTLTISPQQSTAKTIPTSSRNSSTLLNYICSTCY